MPPSIPLRPTTFLLGWICPRCRTTVLATTHHPASSAGDRSVLADELQPELGQLIDTHNEGCNVIARTVCA